MNLRAQNFYEPETPKKKAKTRHQKKWTSGQQNSYEVTAPKPQKDMNLKAQNLYEHKTPKDVNLRAQRFFPIQRKFVNRSFVNLNKSMKFRELS